MKVRRLREGDAEVVSGAFAGIGWNKPASRFLGYLKEQSRGEREVFVAFAGEEFAGYVTLSWRSGHPPFREEGVPEVTDLNVLPRFRRMGIATRLMDEAEKVAARSSSVVGIGVGMTAEYGAAQRMYILRGYVPDGRGLVYAGRAVEFGELATVNDHLALYLTKTLDA